METLETAGRRLVEDPVAPPASLEELRARTARRRRRTTGRLAAAAAAVVVVVVAGSLQLGVGDHTQEVQTVDRPHAGSRTFQDLVRLVPSTGGALDGDGQIRMYDYAAAREALGIAPPGDDPDDWQRYLLELPDALHGGIAWSGGAMPDEVHAELGLDPTRVDRVAFYASFLGAEPDTAENLVIAEGDIDPGTVDRTVRAVPYWGERTVAEPIDGGATLYRWDDSDRGIEHRTPVRPLGSGGHALAVADGWAAFAIRPSNAQAAADLRGGDGPSLADSADIRRLAELADRHGAQAASIMRSGRRPGGAGDAADGTGLPAPASIDWTLNAWRAGPDGASATLALLTDDVAAAAEAMELLADHEPERDGELVWVTIDGDADAVAAELSEAAHAVGLPILN